MTGQTNRDHDVGPPSSSTKIQSLADEFYRWRYEESPVAASDAGKHDADDRLADYSTSALARRRIRNFGPHFSAGLEIVRHPRRLLLGMWLPQALSWVASETLAPVL